jgi:hypothetical protein
MWSRTWPIAPSTILLRNRWQRLASAVNLDDRKLCFVQTSSGRGIDTKVQGLAPIANLKPESAAPMFLPFAYRSFDRQWCIADPRLAKTDSPSLWQSLSDAQIFMVSKPTSELGAGPAAVATVSVPDKDSFKGSEGGKDVFPLYRDANCTPNVDPQLFAEVVNQVRGVDQGDLSWENFFCYLYGVLAGTDYTNRFAVELQTPGPRVPITLNRGLFDEMARIGRNLISLHTHGARFADGGDKTIKPRPDIVWDPEPKLGPADSKEVSYNPDAETLKVGDGVLKGLPSDVWNFSVSGMQVVKKWLGYRTRKGAGKAASSHSPLDKIRPTEWDPAWSNELKELIEMLSSTQDHLVEGNKTMNLILEGDLLQATSLPVVDETWRKAPASKPWWLEESALF